MLADSRVHLGLTLDLPADFEPEETEEETAALGRMLAGLHVGSVVEPRASEGEPSGAKGLQTVIGALTVIVSGTKESLGTVLDAIRSWVSLSASRSVVVEIDGDRLEVTGVTVQEMSRLIDLFIERHARELEG
ncbi:hypothetical protein [Streptosporangium sp. 'caverna']|uniref:hypothetical protein n=1 Tax=Streptosporangium sp. 'caverna' TaxID=2202249 RepID=UPI000D7E9707|nr:hypothetical protein [Streptosporangium sp. 'caverna']AWS46166.1 hypothetical protein DKM19_37600 [Streptosporangium sp. 'caverna']